MKRRLCLVALVLASQQTVHAADPVPVRSVETLKSLSARAAQNGQLVMFFFTASDGTCANCEKMRRRFFDDPKFTDWAQRYAVIGEVDFTGAFDTGGDKAAVLEFTHAQEVPSIGLLAADGRLLAWAAAPDAPDRVAAAFHKIYQREIANVPWPNQAPAQSPLNVKTVNDVLKLKMIVGTAQRRLATINDETFFAGETHRITLGSRKVAVRCLEIREKSVIINMEGATRPWELPLGEARRVSAPAVEPESPGTSVASTHDPFKFNPQFWSRYQAMDYACVATTLVALALYFPFCWSCRQLCRRAGAPSYVLVWLPGLKRLALFRAVGLSWFWFFLGILIPPVGAWAWIVCCSRLCETFHRTKWLLLLLIWPLIGWPVFMYLAWASREDENEPAVRAQDHFRYA